MLKLIINEYAKIFHKKMTYFMLAALLGAIIVTPIAYKAFSTTTEEYYYEISYEDEIRWAEENHDYTFAAILKKAQDIGLPSSCIYGNQQEWRYTALNDLYYNYWMHFSLTEEEKYASDGYYYEGFDEPEYTVDEATKKEYETLFNNAIKYVESNDWKGYYQNKINQIQNDPSYTAEEKYVEIYTYQYMIDHNILPGSGSWQEEALNSYNSNIATYTEQKALKDAGEYYDEKKYNESERACLIAKYRLDNNIEHAIYEYSEEDYYSENDIYLYTSEFYNNMKNSLFLLIIVMVIVVVIAGGIISSEFTHGTIKFLLINPVKRSKIFWSKYITVFSFALLLTVLTFILEYIMSIIVFGPEQLDTAFLTIKAGNVVTNSSVGLMIGKYCMEFIKIFIVFTLAFTISSLFRNSSAAISFGLVLYFASYIVCEMAAYIKLDFLRYTLFATLDITQIKYGFSYFAHMTVEFALAVIAVHIVLFLLTAYDAFTKKNV